MSDTKRHLIVLSQLAREQASACDRYEEFPGTRVCRRCAGPVECHAEKVQLDAVLETVTK